MGFPAHLSPFSSYNDKGNKVWGCELDIYGKARNFTGEKTFIPFRYQGQYEDKETGLYYNRFRYYSSDTGTYISQDPIRLQSGEPNLYAYVNDSNSLVDIFGLSSIFPTSTVWTAPSTGTGNTYKVFQQGIDFDAVDSKGRTNLERMSKGNAPLGSDGKSINLHHSKQQGHGPLFEVTNDVHTKHGHTNALHPYRVTPNADGTKFNPFDPVQRKPFENVDRPNYWKDRARAEQARRAQLKGCK
ncbi:RHS repeat-associated core domain-containing protein [Tenacibaculum sp. SDUM215027]|uniref:RHS repeat-associated core domain-containing protein n=1 Tax=Tenacibaculum sp. SDUM215027 TaxID=3422596 RepID=UPI003D318CBE